MWTAVLYILGAYLIGAIPFAYLVAKKLKGIDIREHGSGNVGATNVGRVVGKKAGLTVLTLDFLKGLLPVLGAKALFGTAAFDPYHMVPVLVAIAAIVGHSRSIFIGFSGGKSVITSLGTFIALQPIPALLSAVAAISLVKLTRYVSVGSMLGAVLMPLFIWLFHGPTSYVIVTSLIALYIIYLHRSNIRRLMSHRENQI